MPSLELSVGRDERQIRDALELRYRVYGDEGLIGDDHPDGRAGTAADFSARTTHLLVHDGREPVGTLRLTGARRTREPDSSELGFEIEASFALGGFADPAITPAEVTRFCVLRRCRGSRVTAMLYAGLLEECARLGLSHLVASANMETDSAEDAALAYRAIEARCLLDSRFRAVPKTSVLPPPEPRRTLYGREQRASSLRDDAARIKLPRALSLFATSMHARYIGPPNYEPRFNVFALPLVAEVATMRRRHTTRVVFAPSRSAARLGPPEYPQGA
jgi:L-ornithine Nalpha-acyltransferase